MSRYECDIYVLGKVAHLSSNVLITLMAFDRLEIGLRVAIIILALSFVVGDYVYLDKVVYVRL